MAGWLGFVGRSYLVAWRPGYPARLVNVFTKPGYTGGRSTWATVRQWCGAAVCLSFFPMAKKNRGFEIDSAARSLQENASNSGAVAGASCTLVGAIVLLGGLGYGFDLWRDSAPWGLMVGLALGIIVGFYELVKVAWRRPL